MDNKKLDDVAYIEDMIDILTSKYHIDPKRVYLTGWSNGAMLTFRSVCELGDKIRAAAPFAGALEIKKVTKKNSAGKPAPYNPLGQAEIYYFKKM